MKNRKLIKKRVGTFLLMVVFCSYLIINYFENYFSSSRKITHRKSELGDDELKILNKLEKDVVEFEKVGALKMTEDNIFYPTHKSEISERILEVALEGTDLKGNVHSFIKVEKKYGVNALCLLTIANHGSDFRQNRIAKDKNNLFGFDAIDSNPYSGASQYDSPDEGIQDIGKKIKMLYLSDDGKYFRGCDSYAMNKNYVSDKNWGEKVDNHMILIAQRILSSHK